MHVKNGQEFQELPGRQQSVKRLTNPKRFKSLKRFKSFAIFEMFKSLRSVKSAKSGMAFRLSIP